jgi:hypothetical protein
MTRDYNIENYGAIWQTNGSFINDYGHVFWYNNEGELHNETGPAVILHDGMESWYINGLRYSFVNWCLETGQSGESHLTPEMNNSVKSKLKELEEVRDLTKRLHDIAVLNLDNYKSENNIEGFQNENDT